MNNQEELPTLLELMLSEPFREDPYPWLSRLREQDHVHFYPDLGMVYIIGHDELDQAMLSDCLGGDTRLWDSPYNWNNPENREREPLKYRLLCEYQTMLPTVDPPDHKRIRSVFQPFFTPNGIKKMEDAVREETEFLLDELGEGGDVDFLSQFATRLPLRAIFRLLNMPMDDIPAFTGWIELTPIDIVAHSTEEVQQVALDAMTNMKNYFRDFVAERKNHVQDGLIDRVIEAGESGAISEEELLSNLVSLTMAGHDTTISLLSNGLYLLLQYPEQMTLLREDRSLLKSAIEEMLRYEPGSNVLNRIALRDFTLKDGRTIAKGTMCTGLTNSTNRDPAAFEDPDTFDIRRHPNPHQTFGRGFHQCLGAELSRLEARVAFTHLLDRFARIELRPGAHWNLERLIIRRLDTLPVVLGN